MNETIEIADDAATDERTDDGIALTIPSDDLYRIRSALFEGDEYDLRRQIPAGKTVERATVRLPAGDWERAAYLLEAAADRKADDGAGASARYTGRTANRLFGVLDAFGVSGADCAFAGTVDKLRTDTEPAGKWAGA